MSPPRKRKLTFDDVLNAPVLNGGFDALVSTVGEIKDKVDEIHDVLYEPDNGIFARVKESARDVAEVSEDHKALTTKVDKHEALLLEMVGFKNSILKVLKVIAAGGVVGAGGTGIVKLLYDILIGS